ncbi:DUF3306 domain-containing protein [uncultured Roseobacter sp.]|uniref:DUF3306 domain-containing protein n=1 Tax=uncultured Roseobacter sp. TaxID=114847 RepID=UPI00261EC91C|nr:DUF3306 domain-containing protein [uncultured Roseobacter sp.]
MNATVSFWERRKAAVAAEAQAEEKSAENAAAQSREAEYAGRDDTELLASLNLPDPATLKEGDDFSVFMAQEVPERFRKIALRKLWRSNPVLANVDGLNEYDDDYTIGMTGQVIKTAYQVGKGMLAHVEEMERQEREALAAINEEDLPQPEADDQLSPADEAAEAETVADAAPQEAVPEQPAIENSPPTSEDAAPRRRMAFRFEEATV